MMLRTDDTGVPARCCAFFMCAIFTRVVSFNPRIIRQEFDRGEFAIPGTTTIVHRCISRWKL
jgi:hypothetical protein